jgi:hypothetical protein
MFTIGSNKNNFGLSITEMSADNTISVYFNKPNQPTSANSNSDIFLSAPGGYTFRALYGPYTINDQSRFNLGENVINVSVRNFEEQNTPTGFILRGKVTATCPVIEPCLPPAIAASGGGTICPGNPSVTLTVTQYSAGTIQWEKIECNGSYTPISGATGFTYIVTSGNNVGTGYRVKVICNGSTMYSNTVSVYQFPSSCNGPANVCIGHEHSTFTTGGNSGITDKNASLSIYPNPFNTEFTVVYGGEGVVRVEVMDVLGKTLHVQDGNAKEDIRLELKDAVPGVYLIKIYAQGTIFTKKVFKN